MCMLLMGCGSAGGFNPLSLNPTLLALPENSFSRTGGQFAAASSQYLSLASNSDVQAGDINFWIACWIYLDSKGSSTVRSFVTKDDVAGGTREYSLAYNGVVDKWRFVVSSDGSSAVTVDSASAPVTGAWQFLMAWHDPTENKIFLYHNGAVTSTSHSGGIHVGSVDFNIGKTNGGTPLYHDGRIDNVLLGKPPTSLGDGTSGSLAHTIATTLYNSGNGLAFQDITSAQESDWGIVSGWLDNSLTADAFGSNTLTNNGGVTQAAGKVNAVAVDNDPTYFVNDASSNDNDLTQVAVASRPLYDAIDAAINNKPAWVFDGTNDWIQAQSLFSISGDITVSGFAVVKGTATADKSVLSFGAPSLGNIFSLHTGVGAGNWSIEYGLNGYRTDAAIDLGWQIIAFIKTPGPINTTTRLYKNGVLASALSASTATPNISMSTSDHAFRIGVYNPATNFAAYNSSVAYVLIKENVAFSDEELNQLGNYLANRFGLTWTDIA